MLIKEKLLEKKQGKLPKEIHDSDIIKIIEEDPELKKYFSIILNAEREELLRYLLLCFKMILEQDLRCIRLGSLAARYSKCEEIIAEYIRVIRELDEKIREYRNIFGEPTPTLKELVSRLGGIAEETWVDYLLELKYLLQRIKPTEKLLKDYEKVCLIARGYGLNEMKDIEEIKNKSYWEVLMEIRRILNKVYMARRLRKEKEKLSPS